MTPSIRTFLLVNLLLSVTLITSLAIIGNLFLEHKDIQEHFDSQLALAAFTLEGLLGDNIAESDLSDIQTRLNDVKSFANYFKQHVQKNGGKNTLLLNNMQYVVRNKEGKLLMHSYGAPLPPIKKQKSGFSNRWIGKQEWRMFTTFNPNAQRWVSVAQRHNFRRSIETKITEDSITIMLLTYPFLALLVWIIVGRGLSSLREVADEVADRAPNNLQPIALDIVPPEVQPLVDGLNQLFLQLTETMERENRFASDAAHELRTPLAALKTQVQVALKADKNGLHKETLLKLVKAVDRASHVVEQLLTLSRMNPHATMQNISTFNLNSLAAEVIADIVPKALEKKTDIELLPAKETIMLRANAVAISILLRNLVDNAVRYTQPGSTVQVITEQEPNGNIVLHVIDDGPGVPEELRERVFERFFRMLGTPAQGSGLGLGIALQIVQAHNANIELATPASGKGLEVVITFPQ